MNDKNKIMSLSLLVCRMWLKQSPLWKACFLLTESSKASCSCWKLTTHNRCTLLGSVAKTLLLHAEQLLITLTEMGDSFIKQNTLICSEIFLKIYQTHFCFWIRMSISGISCHACFVIYENFGSIFINFTPFTHMDILINEACYVCVSMCPSNKISLQLFKIEPSKNRMLRGTRMNPN